MTLTPEQWARGAIGRATDPDGVAGFQCVDVPKDFFEKVTGKSWREGWPGAGDARDMLGTASPDWFQVIRNDPSKPEQLPRRFDIVVYGGTAPGGLNQYGHIGVVWDADQAGTTLIDQDGFQQRAMGFDRLGWDNPGTGEVIGWLRLKTLPTLNPSGGEVRPIERKDWLNVNIETLKKILLSLVWGYKNPKLERDDAYAILRATRTYSVNNAKQIAELTGTVKALAGAVQALGKGQPIDYARLEAAAKSGAEEAFKQGVDVNVTVGGVNAD